MGALNVASGDPRTIAQLAHALWETLGRCAPPPVVTGEWRLGDVRHVVASPERAARRLGFRPAVAFADGVAGMARPTAPAR